MDIEKVEGSGTEEINASVESTENLNSEKTDSDDSINIKTEEKAPREIVIDEQNLDVDNQNIKAEVLDVSDSSVVESAPSAIEKPAQEKELEEDKSISEEKIEPKKEEIDYSKLSKEELVDLVKSLAKGDDPIASDKVLSKIRPVFDTIKKADRDAALEKYLADGGEQDLFNYRFDELTTRFDANYRLIKDKKSQFLKDREAHKQRNLEKAETVLEQLREFVDSEESSASFNKFKEIQDTWKAIGDVSGQNSRSLWANYNALVHRFYDQRSIYFELKELDRKKNLDLKINICERAEKLEHEENIKNAIHELNELHHEYKHVGPVPMEQQEELWQRFKSASDKIYEHRKDFVAHLKTELFENLEKKNLLCTELDSFMDFNSDRIKEWNNKTKEILDIQKRWETIGGVPKEKAKEINRHFWNNFKKFFHNKNEFFKKLDGERRINLAKKKELVEKAIELANSTDWEKTAKTFKTLQNEWKEIGPVPEKWRKDIYEKFKTPCDEFFKNRREGSKAAEKEYEVNLKQKLSLIEEINALDGQKEDEGKIKELSANFNKIGFVPRKNINSVKEKFDKAVDQFFNKLSDISDNEKNELKIEIQFGNILSGKKSESQIYHKEKTLAKQVNRLEDDIALWRNNLEFFAKSKNADQLRIDVNKKIDSGTEQLKSLKKQLRMLRSV